MLKKNEKVLKKVHNVKFNFTKLGPNFVHVMQCFREFEKKTILNEVCCTLIITYYLNCIHDCCSTIC